MTWTVKALLKMLSFLCTEEEVRLYPVSDSTISMRQASSAQSAFDKRLYKVLAIIEIRLWRKIPSPERDVSEMQVQKFDPILLRKTCVTFACVSNKNWIISSECLEYSNKKTMILSCGPTSSRVIPLRTKSFILLLSMSALCWLRNLFLRMFLHFSVVFRRICIDLSTTSPSAFIP